MEAVFKYLFLDIGSEILEFDNANIYVQFGVTFIMFFDIFLNFFYPLFKRFSVTVYVVFCCYIFFGFRFNFFKAPI